MVSLAMVRRVIHCTPTILCKSHTGRRRQGNWLLFDHLTGSGRISVLKTVKDSDDIGQVSPASLSTVFSLFDQHGGCNEDQIVNHRAGEAAGREHVTNASRRQAN